MESDSEGQEESRAVRQRREAEIIILIINN